MLPTSPPHRLASPPQWLAFAFLYAIAQAACAHPENQGIVMRWCQAAKRMPPKPALINCDACHANKTPFRTQDLNYFCPNLATAAPPRLKLSPAGDRTIVEGKTLKIKLKASDPNGDQVSVQAAPLPAGAAFDAAKKLFVWTPAPGDAGDSPNGQAYSVNFMATDHSAQAMSITHTVEILVLPATGANHKPVFDTLPPQKTSAGEAFLYTVSVYDADPQQSISLSAENLPAGAAFTETGLNGGKWTGQISWTPTAEQAGKTFRIAFTAQDSFSKPAQASKTLKIKVK
jgi:hypothetical protein